MPPCFTPHCSPRWIPPPPHRPTKCPT
jgi:hypothetical protein